MKLVQGVGINDANYVVRPTINGKLVTCPFYGVWKGMLTRCYSSKYHERRPTYLGCSVFQEWLTFSNFRAWMETQDYIGKELDKDILFKGNKIYSPQTCVFVPANVNLLLTDCINKRGNYLIGVCWNKTVGKFQADCRDGSGKRVYLGCYTTELEAHLAWKACKHKIACKLAEGQSDPRVAEALRIRYK